MQVIQHPEISLLCALLTYPQFVDLVQSVKVQSATPHYLGRNEIVYDSFFFKFLLLPFEFIRGEPA